MAIPRRTVDSYAALHEPPARFVDIVNAIGEVAEVAAVFVMLGIPIVGELNKRRLVFGRTLEIRRCAEKHEREASPFIVDPPHFLQAQLAAVEIQRLIQVRNADHGVQVAHNVVPQASASISSSVSPPGTIVTGMGWI